MPAEAPATKRLGHHGALDGLRALAVLLVMAEHLHAFAFPTSRLLPKGGYIGVDLFFVLSGFLITSLLLEERERTGGVSFRRFYRRRGFRLFPALAAFIVVQAAASQVAGQRLRDEIHFWIGAFTYTTNWVMARNWSVPADTGHLWSLAVEEQFYLAWPVVLVLAVRRWGRGAVPVVAVAGIAVALASRTYLNHRIGYGFPFVYLQTETRMDALLLGALVAWARRAGWRPPTWLARTMGWSGLLVVAAYALRTNPSDTFLYARGGYTILAVGATATLVGLLDTRWVPSRVLATRLPVAIGKLSYSLYLWHMLVLFVLLGFLQRRSVPVAAGVFVAASFVLAFVSYCFVEAPLRALGHRPAPAAEGPPASAAATPAAPSVRRRPAWAMAAAGTLALAALSTVPAYAARHDIQRRDQQVAAALAQQAAPALTVDAPALIPGPFQVLLSATLVDRAGAPLAGRSIHFDSEVGGCDSVTDAAGRAACAIRLADEQAHAAPPTATVAASFVGDPGTPAATASWPEPISPGG
ncbi:MAG: acyltransferase family protein [Acidimicrobiales bacterium]